MGNGISRGGLSKDLLNLPGRLIAGGTDGVGCDALESRNSLRPDAGENVGGDVSAASAAGVVCEALEIWNCGRGVGPEDVEDVASHFEVKDSWVGKSPNSNGLERRGTRKAGGQALSDPSKSVLLGVGRQPGQKARKGIGPDRADCCSGLRRIPVAQDELGKRDAVDGGLGRCLRWAMEDKGEREQDEREQGDSESDLHTGMVEAVYGGASRYRGGLGGGASAAAGDFQSAAVGGGGDGAAAPNRRGDFAPGCKMTLGGTSKSNKSWCLLDLGLPPGPGHGVRCGGLR